MVWWKIGRLLFFGWALSGFSLGSPTFFPLFSRVISPLSGLCLGLLWEAPPSSHSFPGLYPFGWALPGASLGSPTFFPLFSPVISLWVGFAWDFSGKSHLFPTLSPGYIPFGWALPRTPCTTVCYIQFPE